MEMFEYISVLTSIIIGLGIAQLLQGTTRLIQHPEQSTHRPDGVLLAASLDTSVTVLSNRIAPRSGGVIDYRRIHSYSREQFLPEIPRASGSRHQHIVLKFSVASG